MAKQQKISNLVGGWALLIGVIIAIIAGFVGGDQGSWMAPTLVVIGLIVGLLNIPSAETTNFLLATVSIVIVTKFGFDTLSLIPGVGDILANILRAILTAVFPAALVVGLKAIFGVVEQKK